MLCKVSALINCFKTFCIEIVVCVFFQFRVFKTCLVTYTVFIYLYRNHLAECLCGGVEPAPSRPALSVTSPWGPVSSLWPVSAHLADGFYVLQIQTVWLTPGRAQQTQMEIIRIKGRLDSGGTMRSRRLWRTKSVDLTQYLEIDKTPERERCHNLPTRENAAFPSWEIHKLFTIRTAALHLLILIIIWNNDMYIFNILLVHRMECVDDLALCWATVSNLLR